MGRLIDLTGQQFGRLKVIERDTSIDTSKGAFWICKCQCGTIKTISGNALRNRLTLSCGCYNKEIISIQKDLSSMIGNKFGKLTVTERSDTHITSGGQKKVMWLCKCECGNTAIVASQDLKSGHTKSCGCIPTKKKGSGLVDLIDRQFGKLTVLKRADDYTYKSKDKIMNIPQWLCKCDCGNEIIVQGGNLRNGKTTNCGCERRISKGELLVSNFLRYNNISFKREFSFDDLRNKSGNLLRFDFAILNNDNSVIMLVEFQGEQHYKECGSFGRYQRQYSDKAKRNYCNINKIPLYEIKYNDDLEVSLNNLLNEIRK